MVVPVITHTKVSGKAAGADATRIYGTHWDAVHTVTGIENVENTTDLNKPISTATQTALDLKANSIEVSGIDPTGVIDATTAIQAALTAAGLAGGGRVELPVGVFLISSTLTNNHSNVALIGAGQDGLHDAGSGADAATWLYWNGGASPMVKFATAYGVTSSVIGACEIRGLKLDCAGVATQGLVVDSVRNSIFAGIFVANAVSEAFKTTCGVTGTDTAEAADTQGCLFRNCQWRMIDSVGVRSAHGMRITGSSNANTSFNRFEHCGGQTWNGNGFEIAHGDNNIFFHNRGGIVGGTGKSIRLLGSTPSLGGGYANTFIGASYPAGSCVILGTDSGFIAAPPQNVFISIDDSNGSDFPTLGTGAHAAAFNSSGVAKGFSFANLAIGDTTLAASNARAAISTTASAYIYNGSVDGVKWGNGTAEWMFRQNSSDFEFFQSSGAAGNAKFGSHVIFGGAFASTASTTQTGATYSMATADSSIIANRAGTVTITLLSAATYPGRWLYVKTLQAQTVVSASSNVVPLLGGSAGTAILAATAGKWAALQSDGTNWIIMAAA